MGKPIQRAGDVLVYTTKLKCNSARPAGLTVKCLSGFHLLGWQESSLQSSRFRQAATGPGYQLVSGHLHTVGKGEKNELMFDKMQILQLFTHFYMLIRSTFSEDRPPSIPLPPAPPSSHYFERCYERICTVSCQVVVGGVFLIRVAKTWGVVVGGAYYSKAHRAEWGWQLKQRLYQWFWCFVCQRCSSGWTLKTLCNNNSCSVRKYNVRL